MNVDKARVAAVRTLEAAGYTYEGGDRWKPPVAKIDESAHGHMMRLADAVQTLNQALMFAGLEKGAMFVVLDGPQEIDRLQAALRDATVPDPNVKQRRGEILLSGVRFTYEIPF